MKRKDDFSYLGSSDNQFIDHLWQQWNEAPDDLEESWQNFFRGFTFALNSVSNDEGKSVSVPTSNQVFDEEKIRKEFNVFRIVQSYRSRGHLLSNTNPIRARRDRDAQISLEKYNLTEADLDKNFLVGEFVSGDSSGKMSLNQRGATLREVLNFMQACYCSTIGIEYMHINNTSVRRWMRNKFESGSSDINHPIEKKKRILQKLNEAVAFENFLQTKYVGQKRFSLEGGESLIPGLDALINRHAELEGVEVAIGMPHRGRLNVLANIVGKTYEFIFNEFEGIEAEKVPGSGDVKYHMGFTSLQKTSSGKEVIVKLMHNPSHLETVGSVVQGYCRAQIDLTFKDNPQKILPIIMHGDAAVAGQGIVYEMIQGSKLPGYQVGGSIHFVVNNQIGFTTDWNDGRSSVYCTSIAKTIDAPIFHVNGDDADAVVYICELAIDFRNKYKEDVFIDMVCYRKYGHNEGDEPKFTQPHLYGLIAKVENPREVYLKKLLKADNDTFSKLAEEMDQGFKTFLQERLNNVKQATLPSPKAGPHTEWKNLRWSNKNDFESSPDTSVSKEILDVVIKGLTSVPDGFQPLKKATRILQDMSDKYGQNMIDWPIAEKFAYGSLLMEGTHIRFTGQDVIRGTFSHRHAKVFDEFTNQPYCGLEHLKPDQGKLSIYNSYLSEYSVLGYEYGYSLGSPHSLCIWEAQFGDFANTAQVVIDQFISAGEQKWQRMSGLVMLLPHGYEGQGPEHSSARPERFLTLAAEGSMIIACCTTPANFFHLLRRQMKWPFRKPLIHFSPKSLLRHPKVVSSLDEFTKGHFEEIFDDALATPSKVKRVLWCTGKIYYELLEKKEADNRDDIAIIRIEQLYPMVKSKLNKLIEKYKGAEMVWVQEEPRNMGAWIYLHRFNQFNTFKYVGRKSSAAPAVGHGSMHKKEQASILEKAFKKDEIKNFFN